MNVIMKKLFLLFLTISLGATSAFAQYYYIPHIDANQNPGNLNQDSEYPQDAIAAGWTPIQEGPQTEAAWSEIQTLPFSFNFNGIDYTTYKVSSSGVLTFSTSATAVPDYTNTSIPDASIPDNSIMVWGVNENYYSTNSNAWLSKIIIKTFGTAPTRQYWVSFNTFYSGPSTNYIVWSICFEESTNNIHIVDQRNRVKASTALTAGIQIDGATAVLVSSSPNLNGIAGYGGTSEDNVYYTFIQGTQPQYDLSTEGSNVVLYAQKGQAFTIKGILKNYGTATVTSCDLNYSLNGGAIVTDPGVSINIPLFAKATFTNSIPWTPLENGMDTIQLWASNINGNPDQDHTNDTLTAITRVIDSLQVKVPLFEEFTQASCDPCANANPHLDSVLSNTSSIVNAIMYHVYWPGTDYMNEVTNSFVEPRRNYYGVTGVPHGKLNGTITMWPGAGLTYSISSNKLVSEASLGSAIKLSVTATHDLGTDTYQVSTDVKSFIDIPAGYVLHTVLTVDTITYEQNQSSGSLPQYVFHHVAEAMMPGVNGSTLSAFTSGQTQTLNTSWTKDHPWAYPEPGFTYDSSGTHITVFMQNVATKEVVQSASVVPTATTVGIKDNSNSTFFNISPNPVNNIANVSFSLKNATNISLQVFDITGKKVITHNEASMHQGIHNLGLDVKDLQNGIYLLSLITNEGSTTKRLVISK